MKNMSFRYICVSKSHSKLTARQFLPVSTFLVRFWLLCVFQFKSYNSLHLIEGWDEIQNYPKHLTENKFLSSKKMLPFSTLKGKRVWYFKHNMCVSPPPSVVTGIYLFCGKMQYLIGMFQMPCVIVPTCLIEIKKASLYTTPIKANQLRTKPMLFSCICNK